MTTVVYDFTSIRKELRQRKGIWTMEDYVRADMLLAGYNPNDPKDIQDWWADILEEDGA
jgi:hypothetical protein